MISTPVAFGLNILLSSVLFMREGWIESLCCVQSSIKYAEDLSFQFYFRLKDLTRIDP